MNACNTFIAHQQLIARQESWNLIISDGHIWIQAEKEMSQNHFEGSSGQVRNPKFDKQMKYWLSLFVIDSMIKSMNFELEISALFSLFAE